MQTSGAGIRRAVPAWGAAAERNEGLMPRVVAFILAVLRLLKCRERNEGCMPGLVAFNLAVC